MASQFFCCCR
jgi:hypothetical protein